MTDLPCMQIINKYNS